MFRRIRNVVSCSGILRRFGVKVISTRVMKIDEVIFLFVL